MYSALVLGCLVLWRICVCWGVVWIQWQMELGGLSSMCIQLIDTPDVIYIFVYYLTAYILHHIACLVLYLL